MVHRVEREGQHLRALAGLHPGLNLLPPLGRRFRFPPGARGECFRWFKVGVDVAEGVWVEVINYLGLSAANEANE